MNSHSRDRALAWAFALAAVFVMTGCQSASLPLFGKDEKPAADASIESAQLPPAENAAAEENAPAGAATTAQASPQAAPPPTPDDTEAGGANVGALAQAGGGQGSLSAAAAANQEDAPGVQRIDTKGGAGAALSRRLNKMLGRSNVATPSAGPQVTMSDVAGVWTLDEEDGLRICTVTMSTDSGSQVLRGPNCSGFVLEVASWGLFGPELQLRDAANTVVARLRQSGDGWVGFTTVSGVPLVLSKG